VRHFSFTTGNSIGPCAKRGTVGSDSRGQQPDKESRNQWLEGDDVRIGLKRKNVVKSRSKGKMVRREHAFNESCDCVVCVSICKDVEVMREGR